MTEAFGVIVAQLEGLSRQERAVNGRASCPFAFAARRLACIVAGGLVCWAIGGLVTVVLGLVVLRADWRRATHAKPDASRSGPVT